MKHMKVLFITYKKGKTGLLSKLDHNDTRLILCSKHFFNSAKLYIFGFYFKYKPYIIVRLVDSGKTMGNL